MHIDGHTDPKFQPVTQAFRSLFELHAEAGASLCVKYRGREVVNIFGGTQTESGTAWNKDTRVNVFSVAKGLLSACLHQVMHAHSIDPATPLTELFKPGTYHANPAITLADVLSHEAGLPYLPDHYEHEMTDGLIPFEKGVQLLLEGTAESLPRPCQAYHALTYGWLAGGIIEAVTGLGFVEYFNRTWNQPLSLDIEFNCTQTHNIASVLLPKISPSSIPSAFKKEVVNPLSLTHKAFARPKSYLNLKNLNSPKCRAIVQPALNCVAGAASLCRFYEVLSLGGAIKHSRWLSPDTIESLATDHKEAKDDAILKRPVRFVQGFMKHIEGDSEGSFLLNPNDAAFGHVGAGGSFAFADPSCELSVAYTMNQLGKEILLNERGQTLVNAIYEVLT